MKKSLLPRFRFSPLILFPKLALLSVLSISSAYSVTLNYLNLDLYTEGFAKNRDCGALPTLDTGKKIWSNSPDILAAYNSILSLKLNCNAQDELRLKQVSQFFLHLMQEVRKVSNPSDYDKAMGALFTTLAEDTLAILTFKIGTQVYFENFDVGLIPGAKVDRLLSSTIQNGDVLVTKGPSQSSSFLARMMSQEYNFSHSTVAYVDPTQPAGSRIYQPEAFIDDSSVLLRSSGKYYQTLGMTKLYIYRYDNYDYQQKVGHYNLTENLLTEFITKISNAQVPFAYDFSMNPYDNSSYFCSEVSYQIYAEGGVLDDANPYSEKYWTKIEGSRKNLLNAIGVTAKSLPAPADIDKNSSFALAALYYSLPKLVLDRRYTAVADALYELMDQEDPSLQVYFQFIAKIQDKNAKEFIVELAKKGLISPEQLKGVEGKIPSGITAKQLAFFGPLDHMIGPYMQVVMQNIEVDYIQKNATLMGRNSLKDIAKVHLIKFIQEKIIVKLKTLPLK